jgi:lipopolysaccharide export system protein LptC
MANIDVQKKKSNPLPWIILAILILAAVGYFVWRNMNNGAATGVGANDSTQVRTDTTRH